MNKLFEILNDDKKFNFYMHMIFLMLFTLTLAVFHGLLKINNDNIDKVVQIADKAGIECQVKTNSVLHVTVKKIVK